MNKRQIAKSVLRKTYPASIVMKKVDALRSTIEKLEERNEEWAAEVRMLRGAGKDLEVVWPAEKKHIVGAKKVTQYKVSKNQGRTKIGMIVPPADPGSGGHTTISRYVQFLETKDYQVSLYIYDPLKTKKPEVAVEILKTQFAKFKAEVFYGLEGAEKADILYATDWTSVYGCLSIKNKCPRFYFVQDYEPMFNAVGSYSTFAENTYTYGLYGITAGKWLKHKLHDEFGMDCESFDFGIDHHIYFNQNKPRKDICFYARPGTPRRGFELGILVLEQLARKHPDLKIHCFGGDLKKYKFDFTYEDHGVTSHEQLNKIYNRCRTGIVISFTNMSLIPQEMLATGCIPLVNKADNNSMVFDSPYMRYIDPDPSKMVAEAEKLLFDTAPTYFKEASSKARLEPWGKTWDAAETFMRKKAGL